MISRMISMRELMSICSISRTSIYRMIESGELPKPTHVGVSPRWFESDIEAWQEGKRSGQNALISAKREAV